VITDSRSGANRDSIDLTLVTKIIPKVDLWLQGNIGTEAQVVDLDGDTVADDRGNWGGAGIQPVIHFTDKLSLGARLEYFADDQGARTGTVGLNATNFTVTPGYQLTSNLLVRAEYRYDTANKKVWVDDKGTAKDSASTMAVQFVYGF
jgi:opacity protein-like surface antigen